MTLQEQLEKQFVTGFLNDMSISRKNYITLISGNVLKQILENWCLVKYAKLYGNINLRHWKAELHSHMFRLASLTIKNDNDKQIKRKALHHTWIDDYELNKSSNIDGIVVGKLNFVEGISKNTVSSIANLLSEKIQRLILECTYGTKESIEKYIDNEI